ncbi:golgin-84 [Copidosoma floridanum]|uniref:golgin-84 n=1 Tax=Copidosoma floridanum TaxID=29053 RepID=UPI0006C9A1D0|nr:golgin-84 [Copidosoma floridanum]
MAWLSDLAGKAEEVLNNIDRSTAAVLKKDDKNSLESSLLEVRSLPPDSNLTVEEFLRDEAERCSDSFVDRGPFTPNKMTLSAPTTPAHGDRSLNLHSESMAWLDRAAQSSSIIDESLDIPSNNQPDNYHIDKSNITENNDPSEIEYPKLNEDVEKIKFRLPIKSSPKSVDKEQQLRLEHQKEIAALHEKINNFSSERTRFIREISDLTSTLEKTRYELSSVESELEQHRARAMKTLQERDKLIADLRNNSNRTEIEDTSVSVELDQLRQERELLREENRQIREKLRLARQDSVDAELNSEKMRQKAIEASIQAREAVAAERTKRLDAEEDARLRSEEVRSLHEELVLQQNTFSATLHKHESEISKLRSRLSSSAIPNSEVEMRLSTLTRTLVIKQQELEHLTTDRNALRLQLEKLEHEYQKWRQNLTFNSINDTDDAKALLPSFLVESPFDTGVTRRVKRAYSSLDAIGVRMGVFLRRYPLARIFVVIYITLLQFWVLIVLFSQSPEVH